MFSGSILGTVFFSLNKSATGYKHVELLLLLENPSRESDNQEKDPKG